MKLKQHSLLAYIHPTNLQQLERVSQAITLKKGETLFRQEEIAHSIYFVREGTLKILKTSSMGQEKNLFFISRWAVCCLKYVI